MCEDYLCNYYLLMHPNNIRSALTQCCCLNTYYDTPLTVTSSHSNPAGDQPIVLKSENRNVYGIGILGGLRSENPTFPHTSFSLRNHIQNDDRSDWYPASSKQRRSDLCLNPRALRQEVRDWAVYPRAPTSTAKRWHFHPAFSQSARKLL